MADELNVGKLVAEIVLENKTEEGANSAIETIKSVGEAAKSLSPKITVSADNADTIIYIKDVLAQLGIKGKEAEKIIKSCFSDVSALKQYQQQLDIIAAKLDKQRNLIDELEKTSKKQPLFASDYKEIDQATKALDKERIKLMELEAQFDKTYAAQDDFVKKQAAAYQKQSAAADKSAEKQDKLNKNLDKMESAKKFAGAIDVASDSLRAFDTVVPDVISGVSGIITQLNEIKKAKAAADAAMLATAWATGIISAVGIVGGLIVNFINDANAKADAARQEAANRATEYDDSQTSLTELANEYVTIKQRLDTVNMSQDENISARQSLLDIQSKLISQYGYEAKGIDLVNGSLEEQKDKLKELSVEEANNYIFDNRIAYKNANAYLDKTQTFEIGHGKQGITKYYDEIFEIMKKYDGNKKDYAESDFTSWKVDLKTGDAKDKLKNISDNIKALKKELATTGATEGDLAGLEKILDNISEAARKLPAEEIEKNAEIKKSYEDAEEVVKKNAEGLISKKDWSEQVKAIEENISSINDLGSAYKSVASGQKLDSNTINALCEKYPQLSRYIAETGDVSFQSGSKIKEMYKKQYQSTIDALEAEKLYMEQNNESADAIDNVTAKIAIYRMNLESIDSVDLTQVSSELSNLGNAYAAVSSGQSLDFNTILQLIDTYPAFAEAIASGSVSLENQADVIKYLFNVKKAEALQSMQNDRDVIESQRAATKESIELIMAHIAAVDAVHHGGGFYGNLYNELADAQTALDGYDEQITQSSAKIRALENVSIDDFVKSSSTQAESTQKINDNTNKAVAAQQKAVSDRNEALAAELKLLDHRKKLNQLTAQEELDWLNRINGTYSQNADERMDMEYRLYAAKKAIEEAEEKAAKEALQAAYDGIENKKSLGQMNSKQELEALEEIKRNYRLNTEDAMQLEIKLYNLKKTLKEDDIKSIDTVGNAIVEALKARYAAQKKAEEKRINESIDNWKSWEDKTVKAINGQIDALDDLAKAQDNEDKRQEYEQKRQATVLSLAYEKDDYNRKQLQKELNRIDKEEAARLAEIEQAAKKSALEKQIDAVKEQSQKAQDALSETMNKSAEKYKLLTTSSALRQQAEYTMRNATQFDIAQLINYYAADYTNGLHSIGNDVYAGLKRQIGNIDKYIAQIHAQVTSVAATANAAATKYWQSRKSYDDEIKKMSAPSIQINQTVNFNEPVASPAAVKRQLNTVATNLANQISGGV